MKNVKNRSKFHGRFCHYLAMNGKLWVRQKFSTHIECQRWSGKSFMKIGAKTKLPSLLWPVKGTSPFVELLSKKNPTHPILLLPKKLQNLGCPSPSPPLQTAWKDDQKIWKMDPNGLKMTKNSVVGAKKMGINGYTPPPFADQIFGKVEIWGFSGRTPPRLRLWVNMGHFGTCSWIDRDKKSRLSSIRTTRWTNATHFLFFVLWAWVKWFTQFFASE